jgi:hypothetical protein
MLSETIPLQNCDKKTLIQALVDALGQDVKEFRKERPTVTTNGLPLYKWDLINTRLVQYLDNDRFNMNRIRRGFHEHIQIFDTVTRTLYILMRDYRYEELVDVVTRLNQPPHYSFAYAQANREVSATDEFDNQLSFNLDDSPNFMVEKIEEAKRQNELLTSGLEVELFVAITFIEKRGIVSSVKGIVPSSENLKAIRGIEDWSDLIQIPYEEAAVAYDINESDEDDDLFVALKEEFMEEDEDLTSLKENEKEEEQ